MINFKKKPGLRGYLLTLLGTFALILTVFLVEVIHPGWEVNPQAYPYLLKERKVLPDKLLPVDLDNDNTDELAWMLKDAAWTPKGDYVAIDMLNHNLNSIDQIEFQGTTYDYPLISDIDGDGLDEVILQIVRNDSLFLMSLNCTKSSYSCEKEYSLLVATIEDAPDRDPAFDWDPRVVQLFRTDIEEDGNDELILVFSAMYSTDPRGIWVAPMPMLNTETVIHLDHNEIYSSNGQPTTLYPPYDFDKDGIKELVVRTFVPDNHADDKSANAKQPRLFVLDLSTHTYEWETSKGTKSATMGYIGNFVADSDLEIVVKHASSEEMDMRSLGGDDLIVSLKGASSLVALPQSDQKEALLGITGEKELSVLQTIRGSFIWKPVLSVNDRITEVNIIQDTNGDGHSDISISTSEGSYLADHTFKKLFYEPGRSFIFEGLLRTGNGSKPLLLAYIDGQTVFFELIPNPFYWYHRLKYWLLLICTTLALGLIVFRESKASARFNTLGNEIISFRTEHSHLLDQQAMLNREAKKQVAQFEEIVDRYQESVRILQERNESLIQDQRRLFDDNQNMLLPDGNDPFLISLRSQLREFGCKRSFNVKVMASNMEMGFKKLRNQCVKFTGKLPREILARYRVGEAILRLENSNLTIEAIADEVGFSSSSHLNTQFQRFMNEKPSIYRKNHAVLSASQDATFHLGK